MRAHAGAAAPALTVGSCPGLLRGVVVSTIVPGLVRVPGKGTTCLVGPTRSLARISPASHWARECCKLHDPLCGPQLEIRSPESRSLEFRSMNSPAVPSPSRPPPGAAPVPAPVGWWLLACAALVFAMVVVGGVTRLTGSGLSMVRWHPVTGVLPPIGEDAWRQEFNAYRASPEYRLVNRGMTLAEFKRIFWVEYAHRALGRGVGVAFLVPFLVFLAMRSIPRHLVPRLVGVFVLGGAQGGARVVHGQERAGRRAAGEPVPARGAPLARGAHLPLPGCARPSRPGPPALPGPARRPAPAGPRGWRSPRGCRSSPPWSWAHSSPG